MAKIENIFIQKKTGKTCGGYKLKLLTPVIKYESEDGSSFRQVARLILPATVVKECHINDIKNDVEAAFTTVRCDCSHDCCGCWSSYANVRQLSKRVLSVELSGSMNI